jgi:transposase
VTIVMGLDQHRGQITAEWVDTETGEVSRARVAPAHREQVARFLRRFEGLEVDVALEATTGWRFVVEEVRAVGGRAHLAEPAQTSDLRGSKKRAKSDRADARHLRELLMVARLPESWISPDHILDLRARVRLRHTLTDRRGEWQQRIQAVLYHRGLAQRRDLLTRENRAWVERAVLSKTAREQFTVALAMIDALDVQLAPITKQLRAYARRQAGCRALMAHYGIGALTAVTILAELGDCRRFYPHATPSATRAWTSPSISPISAAAPDISPAGGRLLCAGRCSRPPRSSAATARRTATTTPRPPTGSAPTARAWRSRASCSSAATTLRELGEEALQPA